MFGIIGWLTEDGAGIPHWKNSILQREIKERKFSVEELKAYINAKNKQDILMETDKKNKTVLVKKQREEELNPSQSLLKKTAQEIRVQELRQLYKFQREVEKFVHDHVTDEVKSVHLAHLRSLHLSRIPEYIKKLKCRETGQTEEVERKNELDGVQKMDDELEQLFSSSLDSKWDAVAKHEKYYFLVRQEERSLLVEKMKDQVEEVQKRLVEPRIWTGLQSTLEVLINTFFFDQTNPNMQRSVLQSSIREHLARIVELSEKAEEKKTGKTRQELEAAQEQREEKKEEEEFNIWLKKRRERDVRLDKLALGIAKKRKDVDWKEIFQNEKEVKEYMKRAMQETALEEQRVKNYKRVLGKLCSWFGQELIRPAGLGMFTLQFSEGNHVKLYKKYEELEGKKIKLIQDSVSQSAADVQQDILKIEMRQQELTSQLHQMLFDYTGIIIGPLIRLDRVKDIIEFYRKDGGFEALVEEEKKEEIKMKEDEEEEVGPYAALKDQEEKDKKELMVPNSLRYAVVNVLFNEQVYYDLYMEEQEIGKQKRESKLNEIKDPALRLFVAQRVHIASRLYAYPKPEVSEFKQLTALFHTHFERCTKRSYDKCTGYCEWDTSFVHEDVDGNEIKGERCDLNWRKIEELLKKLRQGEHVSRLELVVVAYHIYSGIKPMEIASLPSRCLIFMIVWADLLHKTSADLLVIRGDGMDLINDLRHVESLWHLWTETGQVTIPNASNPHGEYYLAMARMLLQSSPFIFPEAVNDRTKEIKTLFSVFQKFFMRYSQETAYRPYVFELNAREKKERDKRQKKLVQAILEEAGKAETKLKASTKSKIKRSHLYRDSIELSRLNAAMDVDWEQIPEISDEKQLKDALQDDYLTPNQLSEAEKRELEASYKEKKSKKKKESKTKEEKTTVAISWDHTCGRFVRMVTNAASVFVPSKKYLPLTAQLLFATFAQTQSSGVTNDYILQYPVSSEALISGVQQNVYHWDRPLQQVSVSSRPAINGYVDPVTERGLGLTVKVEDALQQNEVMSNVTSVWRNALYSTYFSKYLKEYGPYWMATSPNQPKPPVPPETQKLLKEYSGKPIYAKHLLDLVPQLVNPALHPKLFEFYVYGVLRADPLKHMFWIPIYNSPAMTQAHFESLMYSDDPEVKHIQEFMLQTRIAILHEWGTYMGPDQKNPVVNFNIENNPDDPKSIAYVRLATSIGVPPRDMASMTSDQIWNKVEENEKSTNVALGEFTMTCNANTTALGATPFPFPSDWEEDTVAQLTSSFADGAARELIVRSQSLEGTAKASLLQDAILSYSDIHEWMLGKLKTNQEMAENYYKVLVTPGSGAAQSTVDAADSLRDALFKFRAMMQNLMENPISGSAASLKQYQDLNEDGMVRPPLVTVAEKTGREQQKAIFTVLDNTITSLPGGDADHPNPFKTSLQDRVTKYKAEKKLPAHSERFTADFNRCISLFNEKHVKKDTTRMTDQMKAACGKLWNESVMIYIHWWDMNVRFSHAIRTYLMNRDIPVNYKSDVATELITKILRELMSSYRKDRIAVSILMPSTPGKTKRLSLSTADEAEIKAIEEYLIPKYVKSFNDFIRPELAPGYTEILGPAAGYNLLTIQFAYGHLIEQLQKVAEWALLGIAAGIATIGTFFANPTTSGILGFVISNLWNNKNTAPTQQTTLDWMYKIILAAVSAGAVVVPATTYGLFQYLLRGTTAPEAFKHSLAAGGFTAAWIAYKLWKSKQGGGGGGPPPPPPPPGDGDRTPPATSLTTISMEDTFGAPLSNQLGNVPEPSRTALVYRIIAGRYEWLSDMIGALPRLQTLKESKVAQVGWKTTKIYGYFKAMSMLAGYTSYTIAGVAGTSVYIIWKYIDQKTNQQAVARRQASLLSAESSATQEMVDSTQEMFRKITPQRPRVEEKFPVVEEQKQSRQSSRQLSIPGGFSYTAGVPAVRTKKSKNKSNEQEREKTSFEKYFEKMNN